MDYEAAWAILTLLALCVLFYGPWQEVCTDYARQVMFEKRDALFDLAASAELNFNSEEYRTIRASLEKAIRFAHELTLPRFILFQWQLKRMNLKEPQSKLIGAVRSIEDKTARDKVERLISEAHLAMILMAMAKSPLTVFFFFLIYVLIRLRDGFKKYLGEATQPIAEMVQMEAEYTNSNSNGSLFSLRRAS